MTPVRPAFAPSPEVVAPRAVQALAEVEAERAALARLLHDDVLQSLIAARFTADLTGQPDVRDAVREAIREASAVMWALRPRTAEGQLVRALTDLAEHEARVRLAVVAVGVPERLDPAAATVAFRVVQAAVTACAATTMQVRVEVRGGVLSVSVCDDGPPYDAAAYAHESELTRWLARAGTLGGSARVGDSVTGGTTLWLEIPHALPIEGDR